MEKPAEPTLLELTERTRFLRERVEALKTRFRMGEATYEEMAAAAQEFCKSFEAYHKAKWGKSKRVDWRGIIR